MKWFLHEKEWDYTLPEKDKQHEIWYIEQCNELGLNISRFTSAPRTYSDSLKRDERTAFEYLNKGKQVPEDIRKRLIETKDIRLPKLGTSVRVDTRQYDTELEKTLDTKLK